MNITLKLYELIEEVLDVDASELKQEDYLVRDLGAESIDLLELSISLNSEFNINAVDNDVFLQDLRPVLTASDPDESSRLKSITTRYPHISSDRANEILSDLNAGPVLKIKDIESYIKYLR